MALGTWMNSADQVDYDLKPLIIPPADFESQDRSWTMTKAAYHKVDQFYPSVNER